MTPPDDVRMRGFRTRAAVADVLAWLDAHPLPAVAATRVAIDDAVGRVLTAPVSSRVNVPPFRRAAMDGWAVRGEETFGATPAAPLDLEVIGVSLPGSPFEASVPRGKAVRIMTGAEVPADTDAVLRAEHGAERGGRLEVREPVAPARHVAAPGEDVRAGAVVLEAGRLLRPQDVALAASIGYGALDVVRAPRIRILTTGDELLPAGTVPDGVRIVDSNTPMLRALITRDGGEPLSAAPLADRREVVREALLRDDADMVLVSGGSSVGQEDHAPSLVAELGTLDWHGVAMRPASPTGVGRIGGRLVLLLPGNPVSCLSAYDTFAAPQVRRLGGYAPGPIYREVEAPLTRAISSVLGRQDYVRATFDGEAITPLMVTGASILSSTVRAQGFFWVPAPSEGYPEGARVRMALYDAPPARRAHPS